MVFDKSLNKETVRNRQLWLKSPTQNFSATLLQCEGALEAQQFLRDVLSHKLLQHNFLLPKDKNLNPDSFHHPILLPQDQLLAPKPLLTMFLHFAYRIRDYLPFFCSFVNFINNNMSDSLQSQISFQPSQQHTSSAVQEPGS